MKRIIALLLVLVMTMSLFAGCGNQTNDPTQAPTQEPTQAPTDGGNTVNELDNARAFLKNMYKESNGTQTKRDYTVVSVVSIGKNTYNVEWTIEVTAGDASCVAVSNDGTVTTVQILNNEPTEEVQYNLVGTIKSGSESVSVSFSHYIEAVKATGVVFDKAPSVGTAYKLALEQNNLGQTLYFTGNMAGYYMESTVDPFAACDVYLEEADGGLRIYFNDAEGNKTYIDLVLREGYTDKANISLTAEPTCVYTWDAERQTMVAKLGEASFYIGTYSEYSTFSVSNFSYIEDASVIGTSQFPAGFCTVNIAPSKVKEPAVGTAYKLLVEQNNLGANLYFTGLMSGYYMASTQNPGEAVDVYLEEAEGGLRLYFLQGENKIYIDLVLREGYTDKANIILTATPSCVYTWDAERGTLVAKLGEASFYIGTYSEYNTFSVSNFSYIEDASVIGTSQFPSGFCTVEGFMGVTLPEEGEETPDDGGDKEGDKEDDKEDDKPASGKITIAEAIGICDSVGGTATTEKYTITGVVTEVTNTTYGNFYIKDETGSILIYGCYDEDGSNRYDVMAGAPQVGDTVTLMGVLLSYNGTAEMKNAWCLSGGTGSNGSTDTGDNGSSNNTPSENVASVEAGVAYKFGMTQGNLNNAVYYLAGGMDGYYMATTTDISAAISVYVEETEGGYYFYTMSGDTKTYINMVVSADGQHVNGAYEATATTVYTFDATSGTLIATVEGNAYWFATRNDKTYTTMGPCKTSYEGFYGVFYAG